MEILIATKNMGKIREFETLLTDLPIVLRGLNEFKEIEDIEETGATFAENAALKAREYALKTGIWALADDSGLEVNALNNAPGVFSARFAGENATDAENIEKLLAQLSLSKSDDRRARFVCTIAISDENGKIRHLAEGVCSGKISEGARGGNGFGYDPIFIPEGFAETFGELAGETKQRISHRAQAVLKIISFLRDFMGV